MSNYDILKAYIFKKNQDIIDKFPDNLDISITNNPYYNIVNIPDNKGDNGNSGNVNFSNDVIEYKQKCNKCEPIVQTEKKIIENINNNKDITISPSININNSLFVSENIRIDDNDITYNDINTLNELLTSNLKCDQGYHLINKTDISIGNCESCSNYNLSNIIYKTNTCDWDCEPGYIKDGDTCLIVCSPGYKRQGDTCVACGIDHYKEDSNTDCLKCPRGSTTNDNRTAASITDCTARPGYQKEEGSDNNYTLKPGNIDSDENGTIDVCNTNYYYNDLECQPCHIFGNGIYCNSSNINYSKRTLKSGYGFSNNTSYPCQDDKYRNGNVIINSDEDIFCSTCPGGSIGNNSSDVSDVPNDECTLLPGYNWKPEHSSPPDYEVTLKPGNNDSLSPYDGIDSCDTGYYYNDTSQECETCIKSDGIECTGGPIEQAKKMLLSGYSTTEQFTDYKINRCDGEREYRHNDVVYSDTTLIPCNLCPIGSISNDDNNACNLNNGYEWMTDESTAPNYNIKLKEGNLDNGQNGTIDGCSPGYYYNNTECVTCTNYGEGVECRGSDTSLDGSNRTLLPGYSWDGSTAKPCGNSEYRLDNKVIENDEITCYPCPTGTTYDGNNGCVLMTGYSWKDGNEISSNEDDNIYNITVIDDNAYYYDGDGVAEGCKNRYYNSELSECTLCPTMDGINCNSDTNRPFGNANITLEPNYSWNNLTRKAYECEKGEKREGNVLINNQDIQCDSCTDIPVYSDYIDNDYDDDGNCRWECNEGFQYNTVDKMCYKLCPEGQKRISQDTCDVCPVDEYKNIESTSTTCSPCPIGSTTNVNTGSESIDSCVARPGYQKQDDNVYRLKQGYIDSDGNGFIDGCVDGYYYNGSECVTCEPFGDGVTCPPSYNLDGLNRTLLPGYSWDGSTSEPCSNSNKYRLGDKVIENDEITCYPCPTGTTYNGINSCELMTGYSWKNDISIISNRDDNIYNTTVRDINAYYYNGDGVAEGCKPNYYYNNGTNKCETCGSFDNGVECPGGILKTQAFRYLKPGYKWNSSEEKSNECDEGKYRSDIGNVQINDSDINCNNTCDGNQHINDYRTGCIDNDGYTYYGADPEDFYCSVGYYYTNEGVCVRCGIEENAIICNGGNPFGDKGIKILEGGWEKNQDYPNNLNKCAIDYYREESDYNGEDTTCIPCDAGYTTNGQTGQSYCIEQCPSDNQYYDETFCPENSSYDTNGGHCICNPGYQVNSTNDGCDAITLSEERMYPPTRTLTSSSHLIENEIYGNGLYETSESTVYTGEGNVHYGYSAFNTSLNIGYHASVSQYSNGVYIKNNYIVSDYKGDWVKIRLPKPIKLTRYRIYERPSNWQRAPSYFRIYGSNDDSQWTLLHNKNFFQYYSDGHTEGNVTTGGFYRYFALVVNRLIASETGSSDNNVLNFDEWYIYGKEMILPEESSPQSTQEEGGEDEE